MSENNDTEMDAAITPTIDTTTTNNNMDSNVPSDNNNTNYDSDSDDSRKEHAERTQGRPTQVQGQGQGPTFLDTAPKPTKAPNSTTTTTTTTTTTKNNMTITSTNPTPPSQFNASLASLPLDWTQLNTKEHAAQEQSRITYPSDVMDISQRLEMDDSIVEVVGTTGSKITHMGKDLWKVVEDACGKLSKYKNEKNEKEENGEKDEEQSMKSSTVTDLVFRSHVITKMEGLRGGFPNLQVLELYDNSITELRELGPVEVKNKSNPTEENENETEKDEEMESGGKNVVVKGMVKNADGVGKHLRVLDMSFNVIRDMKPVQFCPNLVELYLANNKLKEIKGISSLTKLRKIDLGANRIRVMEESELCHLTNLEELWLGKNKITQINGLKSLTKLRRLDVQSNRLTSIENLEAQVDTLEELYLAHNGIDNEGASHPTGLALKFTSLSTLDISKNKLTSCHPFAHLTELNDLWISYNDIATFEDVEPISILGTGPNAQLEEVYLEHNPVYKEFEYRKRLKEMIPSLVQIDATRIDGGMAFAGGLGPMGGIAGDMGTGGVGVNSQSREDKMRELQDKMFAMAKQQKQG